MSTIIYTHTDEAPALATKSFLPIVEAFASAAGVSIETRDISLAGRIIASFPERLTDAQRIGDHLAELGDLAKTPEANIIKLPNISASVPQMKACIAELRSQGYDLPDYPDDPETDEERDVRAKYDKVKGSAVNPVLREGNSDRRAPKAVKAFARAFPHSMGAWSADSKTNVATMSSGDFRSNEQSVTATADTTYRIEFVAGDGPATVLKEVPVLAGEVVDSTFMSVAALRSFLEAQVARAAADDILFSLHMKATMMKVSDPIIFGHGVRAYFADVFAEYGQALDAAGADPNNGLGNVLAAVASMGSEGEPIAAAFAAALQAGADMAMVDSDRGITNLHVPSDVIIDASMPAMIRTSGQMWNAQGEQQDCLAVIPDSSYAGLYQVVIDDCRANGAYDPTTMGSVPNVGLMAQKAEEYGSHDKTFELDTAGTMRVVDTADDSVVMSHAVDAGDIWRMCTVKHAPILDWVKLAVGRARATGAPVVFWLDADRAHDAQIIAKLEAALASHDTDGLTVEIMSPVEATAYSLDRIRRGEDTISATGNVLRDYLTDLFPILELGTSAKMLSIVPLMNGGGLFETGAGGSAPKHVQQFEKENHLRWDSLGEFLALAVSFDHLADVTGNEGARILGAALDDATGVLLQNGNGPSRRVGEPDNRTSHVHLARYWARAMASQSADAELAARFAPLADALDAAIDELVTELNEIQGEPQDIGGYFNPDHDRASAAMRPSSRFNDLIASL